MTKKQPEKPTKEEIEAADQRRRDEENARREAEYWGPHGLRINGQPVTSINKGSYM